MSTCLSDFALDDLVLRGEEPQRAAAHLDGCDSCRRRREERRSFALEFERGQAERFWREVRREGARRRKKRWMASLALPVVVAFTGVTLFLLVRPARRDDSTTGPYFGAKGAASLEIHCRRAGDTFALSPEDVVRAGDELRFVPRLVSSTPRYVQVASIDGTGEYVPFYPPLRQGSSIPLPPRGQALEGSIRLDGAPGPERLFYVFSSRPLAVAAVEHEAKARVSRLQPSRAIDGVEVESGWIVLAKTDGRGAP